MAINFTKLPKRYSGSLNPNFIEMRSSAINKKDIKIKFEYKKDGDQLIQPMYLTPDNNQKTFIDLNRVLNNYVKPFSHSEQFGQLILREPYGSFKYDIETTETYINQILMADHNWYDGNEIIITTVQPHNFTIGDVVYIEITNVNNPHAPATEQGIINTLQGTKVVNKVLNLNQFTIKGHWPGSTDQTEGIIIYNDRRREIDNNSSGLINHYVIYGDNTHNELYSDSSPYNSNDWNHIVGMNPLINREFTNVKIKKDQDFYLRFFDPEKTIKTISFLDGLSYNNSISMPIFDEDVYQINLNPWSWNIDAPDSDYFEIRIVDEFFNILFIKLYIDKSCDIFNDKLIFVDRKGAISSIYTTLDKKKTVSKNNDGHIYRKMYDKNYYINTENNYSETIELNTNWLDSVEYNHLMDLFVSPYVWYVEEGKEPQLCRIIDNQMDFKSSFHYRYQQKITIELI